MRSMRQVSLQKDEREKIIMSPKNNTAKKTTAPVMPARKELDVTDPRRKLTRDEWKGLTKEQKATRKAARQAARGPVKARMTKLVLQVSKRLERLSGKFEAEKPIQTALAQTSSILRTLSSDIDELPNTWSPSGRAPKHNLTAGMHVVLVEAKVAHYEELLGDDIGELEVISAVGKRVVVKTVKGGVRLFLEARHIKAAPEQA